MTGYQSKRAMAQAIDKVNWADHEPDGLAQPHSPVFTIGNAVPWVMRITADRRIEVNEDVEVKEAAQKVLDALQHLLLPQPEQEPQVCCGEYDTCLRACTLRGRHLAQPEQEPVALVIDGVLVKSALPEKYTGHLYTTPPQRTEQNFCPRCGKRTQDIHTCTPPQEKNT